MYTYQIITFLLNFHLAKLSVPKFHFSCHYKIVTFVNLPIIIAITELSFPNCRYQIVVTKLLSLPNCHLTKSSLPNCHYRIVITKMTLPKIGKSDLPQILGKSGEPRECSYLCFEILS